MMESYGHNSYDVHRKTGLQPSTITRYLKGESAHLKPDSVVKLARLYHITESQFRGDVPINGVHIQAEQPELKELLPLDEYQFVSNVKNMDPSKRGILYQLAEMLVAEPHVDYQAMFDERRKKSITPNPQLRIGEKRYKAPQKQTRKITASGPYTSKSRQSA